MTGSRGERLAAAAGIVFAGLLAAAIALTISGAPDDTSSRQEIASFYNAHGGRLQVAGLLIGFAGFCLLAFVGALRGVLRRSDGERGGLSSTVFGAGLVAVAMLFVMGAFVAAVGTAADWFDTYRVNADVARTMEMGTLWLAIYAGIAGGVMVGASSILALRTRVLPKWLALLGFPVALVGLAGIMNWGLGFPVVAAWILLASIVLTVRPAPSVQPAEAAPTAA
jgi:hypothetical protein